MVVSVPSKAEIFHGKKKRKEKTVIKKYDLSFKLLHLDILGFERNIFPEINFQVVG